MLIPLPKEAENWDSPRKKMGGGGGGEFGGLLLYSTTYNHIICCGVLGQKLKIQLDANQCPIKNYRV